MKIIPAPKKLVILKDTPRTKSKGGIIIPDVARAEERNTASKGTIVALNPNNNSYNDSYEVGMKVIYNKFGGAEFQDTDTGVKYELVHQKEVFAIVFESEEDKDEEQQEQ